MSDVTVERYPGESIGLPEKGPGSLATWRARIGAMIGDWAASMIVAIGLFGMDVMTGSGWKSFMIMAVYFVEASVLTALTGASFGQLIARDKPLFCGLLQFLGDARHPGLDGLYFIGRLHAQLPECIS